MSTSVVTNYGDSCCKVLVDSDWASHLRSELQFLSQPVARIVSDDNNGLNKKKQGIGLCKLNLYAAAIAKITSTLFLNSVLRP